MTDIFDTYEFNDWGEQLVVVIKETARLVYNEKEVEAISNGDNTGSPATRSDFSALVIKLITNAAYIKTERHHGLRSSF